MDKPEELRETVRAALGGSWEIGETLTECLTRILEERAELIALVEEAVVLWGDEIFRTPTKPARESIPERRYALHSKACRWLTEKLK